MREVDLLEPLLEVFSRRRRRRCSSTGDLVWVVAQCEPVQRSEEQRVQRLRHCHLSGYSNIINRHCNPHHSHSLSIGLLDLVLRCFCLQLKRSIQVDLAIWEELDRGVLITIHCDFAWCQAFQSTAKPDSRDVGWTGPADYKYNTKLPITSRWCCSSLNCASLAATRRS